MAIFSNIQHPLTFAFGILGIVHENLLLIDSLLQNKNKHNGGSRTGVN